ncbi:glycosyltransferase family 4 protein [Geomonas edaphica]|uniref:glycosyltransferase family 4 protein n=1 Tax=Geomonas edaphica TaxID=2570226 RepID=UPI0013A5E48A|nr:glycosyltransferase family 4 protein [Geomonas edaphica]
MRRKRRDLKRMPVFRRLKRMFFKAATFLAVKASHVVDAVMSRISPQDEERVKLLILDDFFPGVLSAFRVAEYNHYLEQIPGTEVHSIRPSNLLFKSKGSFQDALEEYSQLYPEHARKVRRFNRNSIPSANLVYTVFINNIYAFIDDIDRGGVPFVFTLYPGGGFFLNDSGTDLKLSRVFSSPNFRKVFVTQKITRQYLLDKGYCRPEDVILIYGCVLPSQQLSRLPLVRRRYRIDKPTLDICFVAAKYTPRGEDKGYDVFIDVAKRLCGRYPDINFHVVGNFGPSDIDVCAISDRITFYGLRNTDFFPEFYSKMDLVLSPNAPFVIAPGAFDGFPTGSCMEAGLCGVAVFCTDPLDQNVAFKNGEEIVIIKRDAAEIARIVEPYYHRPEMLYELGHKGREAFSSTLALDVQMAERIKVLRAFLDK